MSASTSRVTIQQLKPLIRSLPASPLSDTVQLSDALESIAERAVATSLPPTTGSAISPMESLKVAGHHRKLLQMRESISRIRSGAALRDYPLTETTLSPPNDPLIYTRIRNGFHKAAQGIQRPWWKIFFGVKGAE